MLIPANEIPFTQKLAVVSSNVPFVNTHGKIKSRYERQKPRSDSWLTNAAFAKSTNIFRVK